MQRLIEKAAVLVEALPYIQEFRDAVVVVKFGGSIMEDDAIVRGILRDIVFMECAGMRPLVVHGGGKAISNRLKDAGIPTRFVHGLRVTDEQTIHVVDDVLHNVVNARLVEIIESLDGRPAPVSGKEILRAERHTTVDPETGREIDLGFVGRVMDVRTDPLTSLLEQRRVPVVTPLAVDAQGNVYNVNADMAACRIAAALHARKLVFLSDVPGILRSRDDDSSVISTIRAADVERLIADGIIAHGMIPKIRSAVEALEAGTGKVHMIDGRIPHALLLEIFTKEGIGTEIVH